MSTEIREPLQVMFQSSDRLIKLVNDMLDIAKLEAGKIEYLTQRIHLKELLESFVFEYKKIVETQ